MALIKVLLKQSGEVEHVAAGTRIDELARKHSDLCEYPIMAGKIGNSIHEITRKLHKDCELEFLDVSDKDGLRIYTRGVLFILFMAVRNLWPDVRLFIHHSLGSALVCDLEGKKVDQNVLSLLKKEMERIVDEDLPFEKDTIDKFEAIEMFKEDRQLMKSKLFKYRKKSTVNIFRCQGYFNYFYGYMPSSSGSQRIFDLLPYRDVFVLNLPTTSSPGEVPQFIDYPKLASVNMEGAKWGRILGVHAIGELNEIIAAGTAETTELIRTAEALHEKKMAQIADYIYEKPETRLILIAGPSSSGKTTFSKRLMLQLRVVGLRPIQISLDDYFVDRENTPRNENGEYDFESIYALDLELFNRQIAALLAGEEVETPRFDFRTGKRVYDGRKIRIDSDQPVIIEGIHGLNELLTSSIPKNKKYKIYVSALTQMNLDDMNRIPTTDVRLLRRIVRDYRFRGYSALTTIRMWPNVRKGEEKYIFPFQEEADAMFNSELAYELATLKIFAEPLLVQIDDSVPEFSEAKRLLRFIDYALPITTIEEIPRTSIIREFIGGSSFA